MQPIHKPTEAARLQIEQDVKAFLKRKGKIEVEPIRVRKPGKYKNFCIVSTKQEFHKAQELRREQNKKVYEVKWCQRELMYHIYDGKTKVSKDGYISADLARTEAIKPQEADQ